MILTRRRFLAAAVSTGAPPVSAVAGASPADPARSGSRDATLLDAQPGQLRLTNDGPETGVLRYAGSEPLKILRVHKDEELAIRLRNALGEPTSLQWHGVRGRNSLDDPATRSAASVQAGSTAAFGFTPQDSGTYWFHPSPGSQDQTGRGMAGVLVVEEDEPPAVDRDIVLFLADWQLDSQNRTISASAISGSLSRSVVTVGNRVPPMTSEFQPGSRLRLRLVNGSTRRVMLVACDGARPLIVAIDGQPSEIFEPIQDTVPIGPGARFDIMLELPREVGKIVRLILKGTERVGDALEPDRVLAAYTTAGSPLDARPPIKALPANPALSPKIPLERSKRAELVIRAEGGEKAPGWTVNGVSGVGLPAAPVLRVRQGDAVTLGFANMSTTVVPIRIYGQVMRLLHSKDDGWEPYWRDSILLPPGSRHHVAFMADTAGRWLIESGFNDQSVAGLRCWFEVSRA